MPSSADRRSIFGIPPLRVRAPDLRKKLLTACKEPACVPRWHIDTPAGTPGLCRISTGMSFREACESCNRICTLRRLRQRNKESAA